MPLSRRFVRIDSRSAKGLEIEARVLGNTSELNIRFHQVAMTDCAGEAHEIHFRTRLLGSMVA